jgi:predicted kinase
MSELIIFIGLPAAGKTTLYRQRFAATHVHVSKDLMPNSAKRDARQLQEIEAALAAGQSVVVDNTNPTPAVRAPLIALGRRHGARVIAYLVETPARTAIARNEGREGKARVPKAAIFTTAKRLVAPAVSEGFDEIHVVGGDVPA